MPTRNPGGSVLSVALDATPLLGARTGIGVVVDGMVRHLAARPNLAITGYGFTGRGWRRLPAALPGGVRPTRAPMPAGPLLRVWGRADVPPIEWWTGPVDVVHGTNSVVPPSRRAARLVSVWDLTPVRYPELVRPTARRYPALVRRAVARGAWVHTGSAAVAAEIVDHFGVAPDRVRVVAPGVSAGAGAAEAVSADAAAVGRGGPPYVLALGTAEPRKDFPGLVAAFDLMADRHPDLELRIAGPSGWGDAALDRAVAAAGHGDRIHRLGWVADTTSLVAGATVLAYPSVYEGFGLPPLEAMAQGVPVVATSVGSLPEVLGQAAELVPPGDPAALADALDRVVSDEGLRGRLVAAGHRQAEGYTWERAVTGLMDLYRALASTRSNTAA